MSVPRSLGFYMLVLGCCFSISEGLFSFPSLDSILHKPEILLMRKISALKNAYEEAKEKFGEAVPEQEADVNMNAVSQIFCFFDINLKKKKLINYPPPKKIIGQKGCNPLF